MRDLQLEEHLQNTLDSGNKVWIIGDIHGYKETLNSLIDNLNLGLEDIVICLGDMVDRGPDSVGVVNLLALILMFLWLLNFSFGEKNYELFLLAINSFFGKFILIGFTWSMSFHVLSGIRHLAWDMGYGFEIKTVNISGIIVIISSLVLTIIFWLFARGFI